MRKNRVISIVAVVVLVVAAGLVLTRPRGDQSATHGGIPTKSSQASGPVLLYVDPNSRTIAVFLRHLGARTLAFAWRDGALVDRETSSIWQPQRGVALAGPLKGESVKPLAYVPVFERAWRDFYPATTWYPGP